MAKGKSYTKPTAKKSQTKENKVNFLKALQDNYANISKACEAIGISRFTYYKWFDSDKKFAEKCKEITERGIDYSESQLKKLIEGFEYEEEETTYVNGEDGKPKIKEYKKKKVHVQPNVTAIIFHLKTKGKNRGYVEKIENEVTINPFMELMKQAGEE